MIEVHSIRAFVGDAEIVAALVGQNRSDLHMVVAPEEADAEITDRARLLEIEAELWDDYRWSLLP